MERVKVEQLPQSLEERLVTVGEMAKILKVSTSWLYQRTRLGTEAIPHIKVGRGIRFDPGEVITFLRAKGSHGNFDRAGVS